MNGTLSGPAVLDDEELVERFQSDADQAALNALMDRHAGMLHQFRRTYFIDGGDDEDLVQNARIGFWKAVRDFKADAGVPFRIFARGCVERQIVTAVKASTRLKHAPLSRSDRIDAAEPGADGERRAGPVLPSAPSPADRAHERLELDAAGHALEFPFPLSHLEAAVASGGADAVHDLLRVRFGGQIEAGRRSRRPRFTQMEAHVIAGLVAGSTYKEIAEELDVSAKAVDNAIQRLRAKLRTVLDAEGEDG